jgi:hypothetical protein
MLAGVACFSILITLHALDNLMNAMLNPLFILGLGGLAGIVAASPVNVRGTRRVGAPATGGYRPLPA